MLRHRTQFFRGTQNQLTVRTPADPNIWPPGIRESDRRFRLSLTQPPTSSVYNNKHREPSICIDVFPTGCLGELPGWRKIGAEPVDSAQAGGGERVTVWLWLCWHTMTSYPTKPPALRVWHEYIILTR